MITRASYNNSPHLAVFCLVNDNHAFVPKSVPTSLEKKIKQALDVEIVKMTMAQSNLLGILAVINNRKVITTSLLEQKELNKLKDYFSEVIILNQKYTAVGNLIAMNDKGLVASPVLSEELKQEGMKVAGSDLVGSTVYVNNKGFIAHRDAEEKEVKKLEEIFKVPGGIGTVNMGDPFVKSAIIGNKKGLIVSSQTSGPELNRIDDIFIYD